MKQPTYIKHFSDDAKAMAWCAIKTRASRQSGWLFVVVDGPDGDFAVVDIRTAQDMEVGYRWAA